MSGLWLGAVVAILTGIAYNVSAALEKREAVQVKKGTTRLLGRLLKRKVFVAASVMGLIAWVGQVAALALAPVALVVPLFAIGPAVLVVLGVKWLHERFRRAEILGVVLIAVGAGMAGASEAGGASSHRPLGFLVQIVIGALALAGSGLVLRWRTGIAYGLASGMGFAAVAIYSKEIGDRFADHRLKAVPKLLASPTPWLMIVISVVAFSLLQSGFQRANAATVMAAQGGPEAVGPLIAGFALYHETYPRGVSAVLLPVGIACAVVGSVLVARYGRKLGERVPKTSPT